MGQFWRVCFYLLAFLNPTCCMELVSLENNLAECLQEMVVLENLNYKRTIRISVESEVNKSIKWYFGDAVDRFLRLNTVNNITVELRFNSENHSPYAIHTRILFVDSFETLRSLVHRQRSHAKDVTGIYQFYYIVLPLEDLSNNSLQRTLNQIMDFCLRSLIVHVNVFVENSNGTITIYTYYPFSEKKCRDPTPVIYNRFSNGTFDWNKPSFPLKIDNFWKCPLIAVFSDEPPFVVIDGDNVSGFDRYFLNDLAASLNFTFRIVRAPENTGKILSNGTITGAFKLLNDGNGDLMLGGSVCTQERKANFAATTDYLSTYLVVIVRRPQEFSSLEILMFPFDVFTWFTLMGVLAAKWIGHAVWKNVTHEGIRIGRYSPKIHILSWLFSIMILRSSYEGSIFNFIHSRPRRSVPYDLEGTIAAGYTFIARMSYSSVLTPFAELLPMKLVFVDVSFLEIFDEFDSRDNQFALVTLAEHLIEHKEDPTRYQRYTSIKKPILYNIICVYMPKFSFLTEVLNKRIKQMTDYGHLKKIYDKVVGDNIRKKDSVERQRPIEIVMSMHQIAGAFQLLFALTAVAVGLFLMELMTVNSRGMKKFMDFFH
ncbi:uncharacterized protein LOC129951325 [Eupeodes corollae]|uniref:uncharacterized protein LOC129951325 n=1 Tax=Eupeodes corollae TaxID=290404 RepID=UPI00248FDBCF|nr:uncharacterized protein LOC129951325 [Eupeodes corollae]